MRCPDTASMSRPSASDSTRLMAMNAMKNGTPNTSTLKPADSDNPTTANVKYSIPVTIAKNMKNNDV